MAREQKMRVTALSANRSVGEMEALAREFHPIACAMADEAAAADLRVRLADTDVRVYGDVCAMIAETEGEIVLNSIVGRAGLEPTLTALRCGRRLALANKESLVVAGDIVMAGAREAGQIILPVDSEHSAIFQSLGAGRREDLKKIMEAGLAAPSGCNKQTTSLIAVDDQAVLEKLHSVIDPPLGQTAPAMVCVLTKKIIAYRDRTFYVQDYAAAKSLGYEFARLIIEAEKNAVSVDPMLNVRMAEVTIPLEYGLLELGAVSGLLGTTTVRDKSAPSGYSIISEVGYLEIGSDIAMVTVPGELVPQLIYGNVVDKTQAYLGTDWELDITADLLGEDKTVLVMGLCNDAIGYIVPDNDYAPFIADSLWNTDLGEKLFGKAHRHYEEMLSTGSTAASTVIGALNAIVKSYN